ncbi:tetratricopeptide repeat protein [Micromonospora ureilytica]|uniref:tetratricopeptide repeat protein n=1 Tax=Micromonospora ureilytica TaxID=709868 RepID=UPI003403A454
MPEIIVPRRRPTFDEALRAAATATEQIEVVTRELKRTMKAESLDWIFLLTDVVERHDLPLPVLRRCVSDLAWAARDLGQRMPLAEDRVRCDEATDPAAARRVLAYAHSLRLRFDFRFDELARLSRQWLAEIPDDAMIMSLAAFAAFGQRSDRAEPLFLRATAAPDYDGSCRGISLQGLWFGTHLSDQANRILQLSDEMIGRGEDHPNLYYWRSFALRRLGRLDEALACADTAIALLPVGMNPVHQDYVREREHIGSSQLLEEQVARLTDDITSRMRQQFDERVALLKAEFDQQTATARRLVSESLLGLVEVLALFVTLAGFLVGSGAIVFQARSFQQNITALALLLGGSVIFFVLLRRVIRFDRSSGPSRGVWSRRIRMRGDRGRQ